MKKFILGILIFLCAIGHICFVSDIWAYFNDRAELEKTAFNQAQSETLKADADIEALIASCTAVADEIASEIGSEKIDQEKFAKKAREIIQTNAHISGIGVTFQPIDNDVETPRKSACYFSRTATDSSLVKNPLMIEHQFCLQISNASDPVKIGTVFIEIPRSKIHEVFSNIDPGKGAYCIILAKSGKYLWHPNEGFILSHKTIFQVAKEHNATEVTAMAQSAVSGNRGVANFKSFVTSEDSWAFYEPLAGSNWSLVTVVSKHDLLHPNLRMRRDLFQSTVAIVFALTALILLVILRRDKPSDIHLWIGTALISAVICCGICGIWVLNRSFAEEEHEGTSPMLDQTLLSKFTEDYRSTSQKFGYTEPVFIPTGCFIQSIQFDGAVNVKLTGYVWQKFPAKGMPGVSEGIIFPEAVESELSKSFEREVDGVRTIVWNFKATLRETFSYATYPFETENIWIRFWSQDFDKNIVLVPDIYSYRLLDPKVKPGIDETLFLPGWDITKVYFNFIDRDYNTNFGIANYMGQAAFPELFYNIIIQRKFLDPFISNILPLFVVSILFFSVLLISTKRQEMASILGFSSSVILQVAAALFFVVIYSQIDLRHRLEVQTVIYMDYFYFIMYSIFLIVSVNAIVFCATERFSWLQYRENLIPKILYWPIIFGTLFMVTLTFFYP